MGVLIIVLRLIAPFLNLVLLALFFAIIFTPIFHWLQRNFRIFRAVRLLRQFDLANMLDELNNDRVSSTFYLATFGIIIVAKPAATAVLRAESENPEANITPAGDAVWWVLGCSEYLIIPTTVGYGDFYPTTLMGHTAAIFVMFAGVALIGVLASYLSNFFLVPPKKPEKAYERGDGCSGDLVWWLEPLCQSR